MHNMYNIVCIGNIWEYLGSIKKCFIPGEFGPECMFSESTQ